MDEEKKKISFIINPKSGTQCKEQILHLLDEKLDKAKYVQEVINMPDMLLKLLHKKQRKMCML